MDTMVHFDVKDKDGIYYVYMLNHPIGKGFKDKDVAWCMCKWLMSGSQSLIDAYSAVVDKAFKESEK